MTKFLSVTPNLDLHGVNLLSWLASCKNLAATAAYQWTNSFLSYQMGKKCIIEVCQRKEVNAVEASFLILPDQKNTERNIVSMNIFI